MTINLIAAVSNTNQLGYKNELLCHLPNDLKRFKELTENKICVQGRKTYESILQRNGKPLSKRTNIILTTDTKYEVHPSCYVYNTVNDIVHEYEVYAEREVDVMVIGGSSLYSQFLPYADYIYLTIIDTNFEHADVHFPEFSLDDWEVIDHIENKADDKHEFNYHYVTYKRKIK